MKSSFRQSMAWLHSWAGLVPGWIMFIIFLFGTASFFRDEISQWMRPELRQGLPSSQAILAADTILRAKATNAERWTLSFPHERSGDGLSLSWIPAKGVWKDRQHRTLDPVTGAQVALRETSGGEFLYRMHFDFHYMPVKWARRLACMVAMAMLVTLLSGIVTHKKIFVDFFMLRFGKGQRSWLDAHNVTAVLALPFHLMMTYTGLVTLLFTLMPWAITANFRTEAAFYDAASPSPPTAEVTNMNALPQPIAALRHICERANPGRNVMSIIITDPGQGASVAQCYMRSGAVGDREEAVEVSAVTGEVIAMPSQRGGASATEDVMVDLHTGHFSRISLRWLYFLSGLAGTAMIATGLVLWTVKRRAKLPDPSRPSFGFRLVERLNIGFIAGAPGVIAAYFLANRLLPLDMANRADWEINSVFIIWGALFTWSIARPAHRAWIETLTACAALYAAVPVVNALTTERGLLASLAAGDSVFVGMDLTMWAMAAILGFAAWKVATRQAIPAKQRHSHASRAVAA